MLPQLSVVRSDNSGNLKRRCSKIHIRNASLILLQNEVKLGR
jgi:hypothetical protein